MTRQKQTTRQQQTTKQARMAMKPEMFCDNEMLRNLNRNKQLVDLGEIPDSICINITKQFNKTQVGDRRRLLTYFVEHRLKNLTENISEF